MPLEKALDGILEKALNGTRHTCVSDLVGERSVILFQRLKLSVYDLRFLKCARNKWGQFDRWTKLSQFASGLKVVNDKLQKGE